MNDPEALAAPYGALAMLVGTWNSPAENPTGYNVMPVPAGNVQHQRPVNDDFQSKNFYYFEEMTFTAPGEATNRGQLFQQGCYALTYEQRVYFAAAPVGLGGLHAMPQVSSTAANTLVHFENGLWLNLQYEAQPAEAYAPPTLPFPPSGDGHVPIQPAASQICKQVSIPHGNTILATGSVTSYPYPPTIDVSEPDARPFSISGDGIRNPAIVLQAQLDELAAQGITVTNTTELVVDTRNPGGSTANMVFEQGNADVTGYRMKLYIEELSNGTTQLQYVQTITLLFTLTMHPKGTSRPTDGHSAVFVHITANTLTKAS